MPDSYSKFYITYEPSPFSSPPSDKTDKKQKNSLAPGRIFCSFIIVSSPAIFYHFWVLANNPIMALRASQNITIAPPFIFIIIGYGFLWPLAALGIIWLIKRRELNHYFLFLLSWLLVSVALVNFPIQFQSRYTQGLHLPLVIFSVVALFFLVDKFLTPKNLGKYGLWLGNQYLAAMIFTKYKLVSGGLRL